MGDFQIQISRDPFPLMNILVTEQEKEEICKVTLSNEEKSLLLIFFKIANIFEAATALEEMDASRFANLGTKIARGYDYAQKAILREEGGEIVSDYLDQTTIDSIAAEKTGGYPLETAVVVVLNDTRKSISAEDRLLLIIFSSINSIFAEATYLEELDASRFTNLETEIARGYDYAQKAILREEGGGVVSNYLPSRITDLLRMAKQDDSLEEAVAEVLGISGNESICSPQPRIDSVTPSTLVANGTEQPITLQGQNLEKVATIRLRKNDAPIKSIGVGTDRTGLTEWTDIPLTVPLIPDYAATDTYFLTFEDAAGKDIGNGIQIKITQPEPAHTFPSWVNNLQGQDTELELGGGYFPVADYKGGEAVGSVSFRWKPVFSYVGDDQDEDVGIAPELYADYLYLYDSDYSGTEYLWLRAGFAPTLSTAFNSKQNRLKLEFTPAYELLMQGKNRYDHIIRLDAALPIGICPGTWKVSPLFRYQYNKENEDYDYSEAVFGPDFEGQRHRIELGGNTEVTGSRVSFTAGGSALLYSTREIPDGRSSGIENTAKGSSGFHVYGSFDFDFPISSAGGMYNRIREGTEITQHWMAFLGLWHNIIVFSGGQLEGSLLNPFELSEINPFLTDYHYAPRIDDREITAFGQAALSFKEVPRAPRGVRGIKITGNLEWMGPRPDWSEPDWGLHAAYNFAELWKNEEE